MKALILILTSLLVTSFSYAEGDKPDSLFPFGLGPGGSNNPNQQSGIVPGFQNLMEFVEENNQGNSEGINQESVPGFENLTEFVQNEEAEQRRRRRRMRRRRRNISNNNNNPWMVVENPGSAQ